MSLKISVIIPVYNREKYIAACLDSILSQTYKNIEIICVDDCSTDNSLHILKKYEAKDNRIKVIALKNNGGVSNARNTGIETATGDYIAFVDSDDTIDCNMFSEMIEAAEQNKADIILSDLNMFLGGKKQNMKISLEALRIYKKNEIQENILPRFTFEGFDNLGLFAFSTKLYKRAIISDNNIRFDTSTSYEEDKLFVIEAIANCSSLYYIPEAYYNYDTSSSGLYSSFNKNAWIWYVNTYKRFNRLIAKYEIVNVNKKYLADEFIYNISWFLHRSERIKDKKERREIQNNVIKDNEVQDICSNIIEILSSFDRRIAKAILSKNRFITTKLINFVYSGKKDRLLKILKRQ